MAIVKCFITHRKIDESVAVQGATMRDTIFAFICELYPGFTTKDYISRVEMDRVRRAYLLRLVSLEADETTQSERQVIDAITNNEILSQDVEPIIDNQLTLGQRAADKIAEFGGSWTFIVTFFTVLLVWIIGNVWLLGKTPFDPYPFILLNLILSCLAAIQAPIIMMSQNRVEQKDRMRGENDYKINLKAELEIKLLHEKIDHLTAAQNKYFVEMQQMQIDYLEDILAQLTEGKEFKPKC